MARYIFITGGVVSSLGKGLASAALGALLAGARLQSPPAQARSLPQRRSGHDVALPARRGLRHRRRRRNRPRPRPLRALHRTPGDAARQHHHRPHLPGHSHHASGAAITSAPPSRSSRTSPMPSRISSAKAMTVSISCCCEIGGTVGDIEGLPYLRGDPPARQRSAAPSRDLHPSDFDAVHPERG